MKGRGDVPTEMTSSDEWSVWRSSGRSLDVSLDDDRREMEAVCPLGIPTGEKKQSGSIEKSKEEGREGAKGVSTRQVRDERLSSAGGRE